MVNTSFHERTEDVLRWTVTEIHLLIDVGITTIVMRTAWNLKLLETIACSRVAELGLAVRSATPSSFVRTVTQSVRFAAANLANCRYCALEVCQQKLSSGLLFGRFVLQ